VNRLVARTLSTLLLVLPSACTDSKPEAPKLEVQNAQVSCTPVAGAAKATCAVSADAVTSARRPFMGVLAVMDGDTVVHRDIVEVSSGRGVYRVSNLEVGTSTPHLSVTAVGFVAEPVHATAGISEVASTCAEEPIAGTDSVLCTTRGRLQYSDQGNYLAVVEVRPKGVIPVHAFVKLQAGSGPFSVEWKNTKTRVGSAPVVETAALGIVAKAPER
jgi:hypothetical protein